MDPIPRQGCSRRHVREAKAPGEEVLDPELEKPELEFTTVRPPESPRGCSEGREQQLGRSHRLPPQFQVVSATSRREALLGSNLVRM